MARSADDPPTPTTRPATDEPLDLADVHGLAQRAPRARGRRGRGSHHLLSSGRPASARRCSPAGCRRSCPRSTADEALEVTRIHSAAGRAPASAARATPRPFRAPHHSASAVALVGGGSPRTRPGEITLAHRGALFLDELRRVPTGRARRAAPAARGARRAHQPGVGNARVPGRLPAGRVLQPVPVRAGRSRLPLPRRAAAALPAPALGAAARPLRPPAAGARRRPRHGDPVRARPTCARRSRPRSNASEHRLAATPWRRNAHIPGGALERARAVHADVAAVWRGAVPRPQAQRAGRGAYPAGRPHPRRPRRPRRDRRRRRRGRRARCGRTSGDHAGARPSVRSRRRRSRHSPASRPRVCGGCSTQFGGPEAALAAVADGRRRRGRARRSRSRARARDRVGARGVDPTRPRALLQRRGTHVWIDGDDDCPIREAIPDRPPVLFGEGDAPDAFARAARRDRRHAQRHAARARRRTRARRVPRRPRGSPSSAGSRSASTAPRTRARSPAAGSRSVSSRPASTSSTRAATARCTPRCGSTASS